MADNKTIPSQKPDTKIPIMENVNVIEFLDILRKNNVSEMKEFLDVLKQVSAMERQLDTAISELANMRQQIAEAQKRYHPAKEAMQNSAITMQGYVIDLRERLEILKASIINGCKNVVDTFKEKGISALNNILGFFKIKPSLESVQSCLNKAIEADNRFIAKIESISNEYHETGRHLRNVGRAIVGKELIQEAKPMGKIAKAFIAPCIIKLKCFKTMKSCTIKAMGSLNKLEKKATEHKPSVIGTMEKYANQIAKQDTQDSADIAKTTKSKKEER